MRPHVEIVYGQDLLWHPAALGGTVGQASGRRLSADEETGAGTVLAHFQTAWSRPGGYHQADTEWYVLTGQATVGDLALTSGGYLRAPAGKLTPPMNVSAGSEALIFTDHGSAEFTVSDRDWEHFVRRARTDISGQPGQLTTSSAGDLDWEPAPWEADDGTRPRSRVKVLYRQSPLVAGTSAEPMTALWEAPPGWADASFHHRGSFAEAYALSGSIEYSHGTISAGGYLYRPPRIQTAGARVTGDHPALLLVRLGDTAIPWRTENVGVRVSGRAVNYDSGNPLEALIPSGLSVTSRSADAWVTQHRPADDPEAPQPSARYVMAITAAPHH